MWFDAKDSRTRCSWRFLEQLHLTSHFPSDFIGAQEHRNKQRETNIVNPLEIQQGRQNRDRSRLIKTGAPNRAQSLEFSSWISRPRQVWSVEVWTWKHWFHASTPCVRSWIWMIARKPMWPTPLPRRDLHTLHETKTTLKDVNKCWKLGIATGISGHFKWLQVISSDFKCIHENNASHSQELSTSALATGMDMAGKASFRSQPKWNDFSFLKRNDSMTGQWLVEFRTKGKHRKASEVAVLCFRQVKEYIQRGPEGVGQNLSRWLQSQQTLELCHTALLSGWLCFVGGAASVCPEPRMIQDMLQSCPVQFL